MIEQASLVIGEGNWAVKSDSLLGYKINGGKYYPREMSVVRATTGTRINEDGLVEVVPYNILTYSEQFNNAAWATNNAPTITANTTIAPNGTTTADTIAAGGANSGVYQVPSVSTSSSYTFSVYVKNISSATAITIGCDLNPTNGRLVFNSTTGTITSVSAGITASSVTNEGNGWYRVIGTYVATGTPNTFIVFGGGVMSFAVWGAQVVEGSTAKDYLPTTDRLDVARIDYSSGSGALLVEPQRTNLLTYSSSFDNAAWNQTNLTVTANATTSPDGTQNAEALLANSTSGSHFVRQGGILITSGITYTGSIYVKKLGYRYCRLVLSVNIPTTIVQIDFDNETATGGSIENIGNGWYRITVSATATGTGGMRFTLECLDDVGNSSFVGDGTKGVYIWGAQLELGSYPTSYIPTQGSTVTRNADVISKTGIADLIGQTEGTVFLDFIPLQIDPNTHINLKDSGSDVIAIWGTNSFTFYSSGGCSITGGTIVAGQRYKIALAYKQNDYVAYVNGVQIGIDTSATVPTCDAIQLGQWIDGTEKNKQQVYAAALYKTRLTNAELASLTSI